MTKHWMVLIGQVSVVMFVQSAVAQDCYTATSAETVAGGGILGKISNPAYAFLNIQGAVADGDRIVFNSNEVDGQPTRTYEFDVDNSGVAAGNVPVPISSGSTLPDEVEGSRALADAVNGDALAPFIALHVPIGGGEQYVGFMWKGDGGYGAINSVPVNANNVISGPGNFSYVSKPNANGHAFRSFVFVRGTSLNLGGPRITVKLVKSDEPAVTRTGFITYLGDGTLIAVWFGIHADVGSASLPAAALPDGVYDLVFERAGCDTKTLPQSIRIVENLIDDATFNTNVLGNYGSLIWQALDAQLCPLWRNNNVYDDTNPLQFPGNTLAECVKKPGLFFPRAENGTVRNPRQEPLPTGILQTNAYVNNTQGGDNECGGLRFPAVSGRRQMWQIIRTNFADDTFATLTGLWAGGTTEPATLTYGIEIRQGDENGTIIAQTTPQQATGPFGWYAFSEILTLPGGPQELAVVVYGNNSEAADAGLLVDELLLRVGADLWPDVDADGDVDSFDFATFQRCAAGADAGLVNPDCGRFDRDGDNDVDDADLTDFVHCGTGPALPIQAGEIPVNCQL